MRSKSIGLACSGRKFTIFALFYFVFEGKFQVQAPPGGLYLEGRFNGGFFALPVWGAYIWRGLFSEFYGIHRFSSKLIRMKEKYANSKMDLRIFFCLRCNLSNDDKLSV